MNATPPSSTPMGSTLARIPLAVPDLRGREREYLLRCVDDNWVSSAGPFVTEIECRMAKLTGRQAAVATVNGTAAIELALAAVGVSAGQTVVVPDWTFAATVNAITHRGAEPWFVDVTRESWSLDPSLLEEVLRTAPERPGAVIVVHPLGHPADMDPIRAACRAQGVPLIEDAAGAIGATYKGHPCGGLSDIAIFSFNGNKTVTAGGGGMLVTDDEAAADRARSLSTQARSGTEYQYTSSAFNYRMTNLNAAVGVAQLERLDEMLAAKRRLAAKYDTALARRSDLLPMPRRPWAESGAWLYSVLCGSRADASALVAHCQKRRIEARTFWRTLSDQNPWAQARRRLSGVASELSGRVVSLPCSSSLTEEQQACVLDALSEWQGRHAVGAEWTSS